MMVDLCAECWSNACSDLHPISFMSKFIRTEPTAAERDTAAMDLRQYMEHSNIVETQQKTKL